MSRRPKAPQIGPDPVLISRKEVDALYEILENIVRCLEELNVDYIVTGGSLLGAIRQHSILFCDDDIDIAIIDYGDGEAYDRVSKNLGRMLGDEYQYAIRPWEGGDKVRLKRMATVFVDIFTLRQYKSMDELVSVIGVKKNGTPQSQSYVDGIVDKIQKSSYLQGEMTNMFPLWQFNTRKAVEMWPKEVYRPHELFPLCKDLKFGPLTGINGPQMPVLLLKRAFGVDCFDVYYQSLSHTSTTNKDKHPKHHKGEKECTNNLEPLVLDGGNWDQSEKKILEEKHFIPMQPSSRIKRRNTLHNKDQLCEYLSEQTQKEEEIMKRNQDALVSLVSPESLGNYYNQDITTTNDNNNNNNNNNNGSRERPCCTVYMDGVFDLFHIGHLEAIHQCAKLGNKVIIGVTGDIDAAGYKRPPIISEEQRTAIISSLREVDEVICPCPLIVTNDFMEKHGIDLVVHGFANDSDAEKQTEFFEYPMSVGKFQRIPYYQHLSTTDIINEIRNLSDL